MKHKDELDLQQWKQIELVSLAQKEDAKVMRVTAHIMLNKARTHIKMLGGLTSEEENEKAKKEAKKQLENTTG